ncbi:MAG TPA: TIGR00266 family protein [Polyangiaceae bacterium]|nr:TIGR00266 family protein [Polyangiaceae bacterium]
MRHEIIDAPDFGMVKIAFEAAGETVVAESGAMVAMSADLQIQTTMRGGLLAAAKRKLLGGESIFQNTFSASAAGQELYLAPAPEGDLKMIELAAGQSFFLQSGAYVAHVGQELKLDTKWGGVKSFFSGVGFFMLKITGPGRLFYASYGAIHEVEIGAAGYTADTGHIVGFSEGVNYSVRPFNGFKGLFFSGEGLVCDFKGHGKLYLQTRNPSSLAGFLQPFRPVKRSN